MSNGRRQVADFLLADDYFGFLQLHSHNFTAEAATIMLFHDAVLMAIQSAAQKLVPVGPPNRYEEIAANPKVALWACRPCVEARGNNPASLDSRVKLGGMNDFHAALKQPDSKAVSF